MGGSALVEASVRPPTPHTHPDSPQVQIPSFPLLFGGSSWCLKGHIPAEYKSLGEISVPTPTREQSDLLRESGGNCSLTCACPGIALHTHSHLCVSAGLLCEASEASSSPCGAWSRQGEIWVWQRVLLSENVLFLPYIRHQGSQMNSREYLRSSTFCR